VETVVGSDPKGTRVTFKIWDGAAGTPSR
jgi:hypothetical protein